MNYPKLLKTGAFVLLAVLFTIETYAQRAASESVTYKYMRFPLEKLDESIKTYHVDVTMPFKDQYDAAWAEYEEEKRIANEQYDEAMVAYNSKQTGAKILESILLDNNGVPQRRYVQQPERRDDFPTPSRVKAKVEVGGLDKTEDGDLTVNLEIMDYNITSTEKKIGDEPKQKFYMEARVMQPIRVLAKSPDGRILIDEVPPIAENINVYKTDKMKPDEFKDYMRDGRYGSWISLRKVESRDKSIDAVNELLNDRIGYTWVERTGPIYTAKDRNYEYKDLDQAQILAKQGLQDLSIDEEKAKEKLQQCIDIWNKEIAELNLDDKKARINNKVGAGIYLNLARVHSIFGNFDEADHALNAIETNDAFKGGDQREAETLREFFNDQRRRQG